MKTAALILLAGLAALPAAAQDRPSFLPSRDVAVTYRLVGGEGEMQIAWLSAQKLQRMDMPEGMGWMVMDHGNGRGFMVMEEQRMVMDMPDMRGRMPQLNQPGSSARVSREGSASVANTNCTIWRMEDAGQTSRACITADGVVLRVLGADPGKPGQESGLEAVRVSYGPQDPARFRRPTGYQAMTMPGMPPGMGSQGMGGPGARPGGR